MHSYSVFPCVLEAGVVYHVLYCQGAGSQSINLYYGCIYCNNITILCVIFVTLLNYQSALQLKLHMADDDTLCGVQLQVIPQPIVVHQTNQQYL